MVDAGDVDGGGLAAYGELVVAGGGAPVVFGVLGD